MKKKVKAIIRITLLVIVALLIGVNIYALNASRLVGNTVPMPFGVGAAVVLSGSMEPELSAGDIIIGETVDPDELKIGDIVTYEGESGQVKGKVVTHEIVDITNENGEVLFITGNHDSEPGVYANNAFYSGDMDAYMTALAQLDLNELLKDADLNELLKGKDLNSLLTGFDVADLLNQQQLEQYFGGIDLDAVQSMDMGRGFGGGMGGGFGGPRGMESSSDVATTDFVLTRENTGFTNVRAAE